MHYLDTSALVAAHTPEAATERVQDWIAGSKPEDLAISPWVLTEFASAVSLKVRVGKLSPSEQRLVLERFRQSAAENFQMLPLDSQMFRQAADFAAHHALGLRAGDALHIAIAAAAGCSLVTLDGRMARAAAEFGVALSDF